jgi:hypothetical protein
MSVRVHRVFAVCGVGPSRFSEEVALREPWPPLKTARVFIVLPENFLQEYDIELKRLKRFLDPWERKRAIPKTETFVDVVGENF